MAKLANKIEASDCIIDDVLKKKYTVDYFQREYNWGEKHIEQLISDLALAFLNEYTPGDSREKGGDYNNYYLGPFVVSEKDGQRSIIDGQQRLTSLTLLLIYLNNLQKEAGINEKIEHLIFSELRGIKSFNVKVDERVHCLKGLFEDGAYQPTDNDDESTINMAKRYEDITEAFPEELKSVEALSFFIDWVKYNVVLVEIVAYSDDNAYTIFETMNDRGLNLTPTEMLKGFMLSRFADPAKRQAANAIWKEVIQELHQFGKTEDQSFFQAWLRGQYADTIRPGKAGSKNEDFEKIGTRFHSWVRDNQKKMGLETDSNAVYEAFIHQNYRFFKNAYLTILKAQKELQPGLEGVYYIHRWGIADSLAYPLMLASLNITDEPSIVIEKINTVARYIETFVVRRSVNFRKFASSSIRYTMYSLVKEIRNRPLPDLRNILSIKLSEMAETWDGMIDFRMHQQNKRFVKFLLSRLSAYVEQQAGSGLTFETFFHHPGGKPFEVEHIWANHYERYTDEFAQEHEFDRFRNRLGGLVLLPRGTNQSYGDKSYEEKLEHYIKENALVRSLCSLTYQNNPNFVNMKNRLGLPFQHHGQFKKVDIEQRQALYKAICEQIWNTQL
jgi:uncharacterized protein with ParB-like and HNH nuclease domain